MNKNIATVFSAELDGVRARVVEVEVDLNVGLHSFNIVGLGDKAINEAKERVNSALKNSGVKPPNRENRKITVNLAPADIQKTGSNYDLGIALAYLVATKQIKEFDASNKIFLGELALDGRLRPINGALNIAEAAAEKNFGFVLLPIGNANEASVVKNIKIIPIKTLKGAIEFLEGTMVIEPWKYGPIPQEHVRVPDFAEIKSQANAKRALTIAAAGGHNLLMIGPPGVGKSLLAQALIGILPKLSTDEAIEVTKIYSAAGFHARGLITDRPFRSPHQTASLVAIVGGGSQPKPGEISLAHRGILFLDELPEFPKNILEALRQPLESGIVYVARARGVVGFPSKFSLIAAMNPCPCGFYGDLEHECRCSAYEVIRYQKKISGPLLDRIDLQIQVPRVHINELREKKIIRESDALKRTIEIARETQEGRLTNLKIKTNAEMGSNQTETMIGLEPSAEKFLDRLEKIKLSPRSFYRLLKTARTIADLEQKAGVSEHHLAEAFSYRLRENPQ